ncbi:toll/interleukin-1 receptor domain-containing protein [Reyranella sp.]|uniref:toll/interleukin-1 receptor domain-containing protein n=1 Tax=Reyranella sp. TaxID=1929291 RepID=UPI003D152568
MTVASDAADNISEPWASQEAEKSAYRYKAFISYRHADGDRQLAQWLHSSIETYRTPRRMVEEGFASRLGVVFRDEEELSASANLSGAIEAALQESEFLVVICSPRTPTSRWVNEEVIRFRQLGRENRILACLIEGEPAQAFPPALHEVHGESGEPAGGNAALEPLAADFRPANGLSRSAIRRIAKLKLFSTLLGCRFDDLVLREQARRRKLIVAAFSAIGVIFTIIAGLAVFAVLQRNLAQEQRAEAIAQRDAALLTQSRFLTDLSRQRTESGDGSLGVLLALEALPGNLAKPDRPYYPAAIAALAAAVAAQREILTLGVEPADHVVDARVSDDGSRLLVGTADGTVALWDTLDRRQLFAMPVAAEPIIRVAFGTDKGQIRAATRKAIYIVDPSARQASRIIALDAAVDGDRPAKKAEWLDVVFGDGTQDRQRRIVTVDRTHRAQLWTQDREHWVGGPLIALENQSYTWRAISPDGRSIASGGAESNQVVVVDLESGKERARISLEEIGGKGTGTLAGAFANRSDRLIISQGTEVAIWDFALTQTVATLSGHSSLIWKIAVSPDDSSIATGSADGTVKLWMVDDNYAKFVVSFDGFVQGSLAPLNRGSEFERQALLDERMQNDFEPAVGHVSFSADGRRLLATSGDRSIRVFDVAKPHLIAKVSGHTGRIDRAVIAAHGMLAVTVGRDGTARLWQVAEVPRIELFRAEGGGAVEKVVMPAKNDWPLVLARHSDTHCGGRWSAWRADTGDLLEPALPPGSEDRLDLRSISVDGGSRVSGSSTSGELRVQDFATGRTTEVPAAPPEGPISCAYVGPGGKTVLIMREAGAELRPVPGAAEAPAGPVRGEFASLGGLWWSLAPTGAPTLSELEKSLEFGWSEVNRDGSRLLVRQSDNAVALYDLKGGRLVRRFAVPGDATDVKFSSDGKAIVGSNREVVRMWDAVDGRMTREIVVDAEPDFVALGGADGTYFVVTSTKGAVKVIDLQTGRPPFVLGETFAAPVDVAIDASGDRAIIKARERDCSDVAPSLWDLRQNRKVSSLSVSQGCPYRFAFSADGAQVLGAVSEPYRLVVWESAGGGELAEFGPCLPEGAGMGDGDASQVMDAGFSDDNRHLYAGTLGGGVCIWPNPGAGPALVERAKQSVPRSLTSEERKRFFLEGQVQR